jgi:hypothetical protein
MPRELKTPEFYLAAVQQNALALKYLPKALKTPELRLAAVQNFGRALKHVPKKLRAETLSRKNFAEDFGI